MLPKPLFLRSLNSSKQGTSAKYLALDLILQLKNLAPKHRIFFLQSDVPAVSIIGRKPKHMGTWFQLFKHRDLTGYLLARLKFLPFKYESTHAPPPTGCRDEIHTNYSCNSWSGPCRYQFPGRRQVANMQSFWIF